MNKWVALESLCRGDVYDNIILHVLETVPPALCKRYIYRLFRNFFEDCKRCKIELHFSNESITFSDNMSKQEIVKNLMAIFNCEVLYNELENKCSCNRLLCFRCKELRELISLPDNVYNRIIKHHKRVRMQLSRLYRIRNRIAHTGMTSYNNLRLFNEHLEDYLADFVSEVIMYSYTKDIDDPGLIFEMIKDNYRAFLDMTKEKKNPSFRLVLCDILETGIIELV